MAGTFTQKYKDFHPADEDVWVETGTYRGHGVLNALRYGFREIHTIEVCPSTFIELETERIGLCSDPRVHRYLGSSRDLLRPIIETLTDRDVVFWLDGHFQGESQLERDAVSECPILAELEAIAKQPWKNAPLVCIDDTYLFVDSYWVNGSRREQFTPADWPRARDLALIMQGWNLHMEDDIFYFYR